MSENTAQRWLARLNATNSPDHVGFGIEAADVRRWAALEQQAARIAALERVAEAAQWAAEGLEQLFMDNPEASRDAETYAKHVRRALRALDAAAASGRAGGGVMGDFGVCREGHRPLRSHRHAVAQRQIRQADTR